jgi:hypothetical protein
MRSTDGPCTERTRAMVVQYRCGSMQAFGVPVDPEVNSKLMSASGSGCSDGAVAGALSEPGAMTRAIVDTSSSSLISASTMGAHKPFLDFRKGESRAHFMLVVCANETSQCANLLFSAEQDRFTAIAPQLATIR